MAHPAQQQFMLSVRDKFPKSFNNVSVLDIGSLDINGNNRYLFNNSNYIGIDLGAGKNVDIVCRGHEYKSDKLFDTIVSTECFEHDKFWELTILNAISLLKNEGLLAFTCAREGRQEHGTFRADGWASPFTCDYYKNLSKQEIENSINLKEYFKDYYIEETNIDVLDLYFWGIKK